MLEGLPYSVDKDGLRTQWVSTDDKGYADYGGETHYFKPCPFCGCPRISIFLIERKNDFFNNPVLDVKIACGDVKEPFTDDCKAQVMYCGGYSKAESSVEKCAAQWNRRDPPRELSKPWWSVEFRSEAKE